jgi:hypothetical protein
MNMGRETYMMMKSKTKYTTSFLKTSLNENSQNLPININIDVTSVGSQIGLVDPNYWIHDVGDSLGMQFCHMNKCIYSTSFVLKQMVYM